MLTRENGQFQKGTEGANTRTLDFMRTQITPKRFSHQINLRLRYYQRKRDNEVDAKDTPMVYQA